MVDFEHYLQALKRKEEKFCFKVHIVDKYGTIEQNEEPSYDIMVDNFLGGKEPCLVKYIRESSIIDS